jgi:hypothetical protein
MAQEAVESVTKAAAKQDLTLIPVGLINKENVAWYSLDSSEDELD